MIISQNSATILDGTNYQEHFHRW